MQNDYELDGYDEVLQEQQEKDKDLQSVKERISSIENVLVAIQPLLQNLKPEMLSKMQLVGMDRFKFRRISNRAKLL